MGDRETPLIKEKAVLPLELFFDLVFVLGITLTVSLVVEEHDARALWEAALVLAMLWWGWTQFTWTANSIDLHPARVRTAFFFGMGAALVMAASVRTAFGDGGVWLVVGYIVLRAIGVWLHLTETTDPELRASARLFAAVSWVGPVVLLFGALIEPPARSWVWLVGGLLEIGSAAVVGSKAWHIQAGHFAERHGLIFIIALGEAIVAVGLIASRQPFESFLVFTMLLVLAGSAALWWSYFDSFSPHLEEQLRIADDAAEGPLARDAYSLGHFPMIVGVVLFAAAAEEVLLHPGDPLAGFSRLLFALSFGLVVLAQSAVLVRVGHPVPVERIAAAGLIMLLMTPELNVRANLMMLAVIVLLVLALVVERLRASGPALH